MSNKTEVYDEYCVLYELSGNFQDGRTALHIAAANGHKDVTDMLLEAGASVELRASDGDTAVLLAGRFRHTAVFVRLIAATVSTVPVFSITDQARLFIKILVPYVQTAKL